MQLEGTGASIQHVSPLFPGRCVQSGVSGRQPLGKGPGDDLWPAADQVESSYQARSDSLRIESHNSSIHPEMCPQVR
jgi:hypothetical protein